MPKWKNPQTGEVVEMPSDGLRTFYEGRGYIDVSKATRPLPDLEDDEPPASFAELLDDLDSDAKGKRK